jgi:hypothetical protein
MMSSRITTVVLAIILAAPLIAVKAHRHHIAIQQLAQYCVPPDDEPLGANRIYC